MTDVPQLRDLVVFGIRLGGELKDPLVMVYIVISQEIKLEKSALKIEESEDYKIAEIFLKQIRQVEVPVKIWCNSGLFSVSAKAAAIASSVDTKPSSG